MGKCSYIWPEWDLIQGRIEESCLHDTWECSDEFCIFHDPSPDKDRNLFIQKLEEQMKSETERHSFIGYIFPKNWNFFNFKFKNNVDFRKATFQDANFFGAIFQGNAFFTGANFQKNANFRETTFQDTDFSKATFQDANFFGATFQDADFRETIFKNADFRETIFKNAIFGGAIFQNANFSGTTFHDLTMYGAIFRENLEFKPKKNKIVDLRNTKFLFMGTITADLRMAQFHNSFLKNISFVDCQWPKNKIIFEEEHMKNKNVSYKELETIYRNLKQNMQNNGDYSIAGEFYYREMEVRRKKNNWKSKSRWWLELYHFIAGYGEKPLYTAAVSGCITIIFAFLYGLFSCIQYSVNSPCLTQKIVDVLYFSFVTFTTLGLGDIRPITTLGKVLICFEATIGAFMIALFVVVFVRKMAR